MNECRYEFLHWIYKIIYVLRCWIYVYVHKNRKLCLFLHLLQLKTLPNCLSVLFQDSLIYQGHISSSRHWPLEQYHNRIHQNVLKQNILLAKICQKYKSFTKVYVSWICGFKDLNILKICKSKIHFSIRYIL